MEEHIKNTSHSGIQTPQMLQVVETHIHTAPNNYTNIDIKGQHFSTMYVLKNLKL
jgi:hypothetical protein